MLWGQIEIYGIAGKKAKKGRKRHNEEKLFFGERKRKEVEFYRHVEAIAIAEAVAVANLLLLPTNKCK